ncbi:hypothetical protein NMG60_11006898 [Bertholletia excelsa]
MSRSLVIKLPPGQNNCSAMRKEAGQTYQLCERKPFVIEATARKKAIMLSNRLVNPAAIKALFCSSSKGTSMRKVFLE